MRMEYDEEERGFFQPIWNTTSNRRIAAIVAWIAMVVITLSAFLLPYGRTGNMITDLAQEAVNAIMSDALGVDAGATAITSFTLFDVCKNNLIIMILFIVALVLGFLLPLLTENAFELLPAGLLTGVNIYTCTHVKQIFAVLNSTGDETVQNTVNATVAGQILDGLGINSVKVITAGSILSYFGIFLLLLAVLLHFILKPKKKDKDTYEYTAQTGYVPSDYEVNPNDATGVLNGYQSSGVENGTMVLNQNIPMGSLYRMNTKETLNIYEGESVIGRDPARAKMVIQSAAVSGAHARIIAINGICSIVDLHSTNGTFVNDQRLAPDIKVNLKDGDYISLGAEILQFHVN